MSLPGAFKASKKDGTEYYRSSITYQNKHISLGSFDTEEEASGCYLEAMGIISSDCTIDDYSKTCQHMAFAKYVSLINFRDRGIYIKTPIYLCDKYFIYYLSEELQLKFDVDDLFFYSNHTIQKKQGYLFVADYGMQTNILSRYGIKNHAVEGKDYVFKNGDNTDFRYINIEVINPYFGVTELETDGRIKYRTVVHIRSNYIVGTYNTVEEAAIAYNKAVSLLKEKGVAKVFQENYVEDISAIEYAKIYNSVRISKKIRHFGEKKEPSE